MNQKVGINVSATADTSQVEQAINALGQKIAQANRVQYSPVSPKSIDDVKKLNAALAEVLKTQAGLRQRLKATGQESTPFTDWDWSRMYPHSASRGVAMQGTFERVIGPGRFSAAPLQPTTPSAPGVAPGGGGGGGGGPGMGVTIAQAGLRAAGPAGGVAAGALGTGASAGFGAGLMGLVGGMAALGVGKLVGAIAERVDQAEQNNVDYDKLKRILGDVGVSFDTLKGVVQGSAKQIGITFTEATRLGTQFSKLSNISGEQYKTISDELESGVGLSRSFGLDPSQGVGVLGQMRGMGITTNTQESRRFALLLGETIGKSGAFSKAEEVFDAIGGFATNQTRNSMGAANVAGFAGMYSSMVGSGIPGMDPAGAAGLLNKINATLAGGGAKGEASQFFTGIVGHRMGLNPFQTQILREGGAFANNNEAFGQDSAYGRYMGKAGPKGGTTFLQGSLDELRKQYGHDKELLAMATANHLGVNGRQAMELLNLKPNEMGEMQGYAGDLTKMSGKGIGNLAKALYGSADERNALRTDFLGRKGADAISADDRKALEGAGSDAELKKALASMASKYDQESTTGTDIRDSKNALENLKVTMADKLVPLNQAMRDGILFLAGGREKSRLEVMKDIEDIESKSRVKGVNTEYEGKLKAAGGERIEANKAVRDLVEKNRKAVMSGEMTPEEHQRQLAPLLKRQADAIAADAKAREWHTEALEKERKLREKNIEALEKADSDQRAVVAPPSPGGDPNQSDAESRRLGLTRGPGGGSSNGGASKGYDPLSSSGGDATRSSLSEVSDADQKNNVRAMLDAISHVEGANYNTLVGHGRNNREIDNLDQHPNRVGIVTKDGPSTAAGRYQITGTTWRGISESLGLKDFSPESQDKAAIELLRRRGALDDVKRGDFGAAAKKLGNEWQGLPTGASQNQGKQSWETFNAAINRSLEQSKGKPPVDTEAMPPRRKPEAITQQPPTPPGERMGTPAGALGSIESGGGRLGDARMGGAGSTHEVTVRVLDDKTGKPITAPVKIPFKVGSASPFGTLQTGGVMGQ